MAFDRNPLLHIWADKVEVRKYVSSVMKEEHLNKVLGIFLNAEKID